MIFSLIIPTVYRSAELGRLLDSIAGQKNSEFDTKNDIETIVVDQNSDDRLEKILEYYSDSLTLVHLKVPSLGLSHARNLGLGKIRGKYVAFPDDDCYYAPDTLKKVFQYFTETGGKSGLFIRGRDPDTEKDFLRYPRFEKLIRSPRDASVFLGISIGQFYPKEAIKAVGFFDEHFGIGGDWGSGEETDFASRCLKKGFPIQFKPDILVYHPLVDSVTMDPVKLKKYAMGFGALCRKHSFYGLAFWKILKQIAGIFYFVLKLDLKRANHCWVIASGRIEGFLKYGG